MTLADHQAEQSRPGPAEWPAKPGEVCSCCEPAAVVYVTERFGEVPSCR